MTINTAEIEARLAGRPGVFAVHLTAGELRDLLAALTTAQARIAELEGVLKWHHGWHLQVGDIGLPDGEGGWIGIDNSDAYSDSFMCEKTTALLAGVPSEVLPRGGVNAHWWQISILQRRKIKELEAGRHEWSSDIMTAPHSVWIDVYGKNIPIRGDPGQLNPYNVARIDEVGERTSKEWLAAHGYTHWRVITGPIDAAAREITPPTADEPKEQP